MLIMQPIVGQFLVISGFGLGYFIRVVCAYVVYTTGVDIYWFTKGGVNDSRTLKVPTRKAFSPGAWPPHFVVLKTANCKKPNCKILGVPLVRVYYNFTTGCYFFI